MTMTIAVWTDPEIAVVFLVAGMALGVGILLGILFYGPRLVRTHYRKGVWYLRAVTDQHDEISTEEFRTAFDPSQAGERNRRLDEMAAAEPKGCRHD